MNIRNLMLFAIGVVPVALALKLPTILTREASRGLKPAARGGVAVDPTRIVL
ncbi:MAG: hypothetical protein ACYTFA_15225 [Planctomycetota bacterium]